MTSPRAAGRLLVVGTPIGNLGDLTPRAAAALREADLVVAEDTRVAARLLAHLGARRPTLSFNAHNAAARLPELLRRLVAGETLALTTDAGMPAITDPGARLVAAARAANVMVEAVPGPTAVTTAVALSGVEAPGFVFGGFLPSRPASARAAALERLLLAAGSVGLPLVLYEAPPRVRSLLAALEHRQPDVQVAICRELTKLHEEVLAGTPADVSSRLVELRGEFVFVVSSIELPFNERGGLPAAGVAAAGRAGGLSERGVVELLRASGVGRRDAYRLAREANPTEKPPSSAHH
ncbi:MAG: 16S rRNA (cytidine(1402)-2'-O)-methyltransferase [Chloroflexota bacterium]|nr:16S rRNA (cytidine(1402)-2'-O)-methyltransferase [Chloroflexota bacterium]